MNNALLLRYARRALGEPVQPTLETLPRTDIVHLHADIVKRSEDLKKLEGQPPSERGRRG
jgi:hypothetical protein